MQNKTTAQKSDPQYLVQVMERGQITIPKEIRDSMGIDSNTWLLITQKDETTITIQIVDVTPRKVKGGAKKIVHE